MEHKIPKIVLWDFDRVRGPAYQVELRRLIDEAKSNGDDSDKVHREFEKKRLDEYMGELESGKEKHSETALRMVAGGYL